jgi:hypothetical protein
MELVSVRRVRVVMWAVTITAALLQTLAVRFYISGDGNSYLDVASAYLRGDFANAINAYWSPFYSWLIALVLWAFKPGGHWETTILHLLNFAGLLVSLRAFEFFFGNFLAARQNLTQPEGESVELPVTIWWMLGYALFISATLEVMAIYPITAPDHWVCIVTFLSIGLILKIAMRGGGPSLFAALGLVLGLGYLTKTFYFPLAFVFIGTAWLASRELRKNFTGAVIALVAFLLVAGPFVFALSKTKHRFTYGDVGKIAYAEVMNWGLEPIFWEGGNGSGTPKHPARIVLSSPTVYEFAEPISGSYPMWYDSSYWNDGMEIHFRPINQLKVLRQSAGTFFLIFLIQLEFVVGLAVLAFYDVRPREWLSLAVRHWFLWLPAAAACLGFTCVLVEGRYVASFLVVLWLAAFASTLCSASIAAKRVAVAVVLAVTFVTVVKTLKFAVTDAFAISKQVNENWEAAQKLKDFGASPGDRVALIGVIAEQHLMRLAKVKAVAELRYRDEQKFWTGDASLQDSVFTAFATTGSRIVVAAHAPVTAVKEGWIRLGNTDYYARSLLAKPQPMRSLARSESLP